MASVFISEIYNHDNYEKALKKAGFSIVINPDSADCMLLGGGGDIAPCLYGGTTVDARNVDIERDVRELFFVEKFIKNNKFVFGICRGLQVINVAFGGSLLQNIPIRHQFVTRDKLHAVTFSGKLKSLYGKTGIVNSAHHQAVDKLGKGLKETAVSDDSFIEGISGKNVLAVQFHPERSIPPAIDGGILFKEFFRMVSKAR